MKRKELKTAFKKIFFNTLKKNGFKRVNKKWIIETDELMKKVELQKSDYSDLNYSFTVKGIDTSPSMTHISFRFKNYPKVLDLKNNLKEEKGYLFLKK